MSKLNRILINVQKVCYIFEFNIKQEIYTRSFIFANELKKHHWIFKFFMIFFEECLGFLQKYLFIAFDYIIYRKGQFSNGKNHNFLRLKLNIPTIS